MKELKVSNLNNKYFLLFYLHFFASFKKFFSINLSFFLNIEVRGSMDLREMRVQDLIQEAQKVIESLTTPV